MKQVATKRVLVIDAHPDRTERHLCHALADAYAEGLSRGGHSVCRIRLADLDFPLLRSRKQWETEPLPQVLVTAQAGIQWAQHILIVFPLWLGDMPALLKGFLEQIARPGFAFASSDTSSDSSSDSKALARKLLKGKSARIIVTMGMPSWVYRWFFRAHSLKVLERNILGFVGIAPIYETLVGSVEGITPARAAKVFKRLKRLGAAAR